VKPYDVDELAARVRAVARRAIGQGTGGGVEIRYGRITLQPSAQTVLVEGEPVPLTNKEFWLLESLVRNRDRIVTRRVLEEALYGWEEDRTSNAVEVFVYQLRRKLGAQVIKTVRGVGYRLASPTEMYGAGEVDHAI